tara:strand:+ start:119308 stop:121758 length:2451 start_codon:yes stop_codon:yes gene_type:complete
MATKRMLIDASHPEETRVTVVSGNRVEDFDVEVESRRQLKGNIYLAKVTRVEPSLQAAFVDYGGNRHGFLAFSEIHPDYYQIPVADREALIAEEEDAQRAANEAEEAEDAAGEDGRVEEVGGGDEIDEAEKIRRPTTDRRRYKIQEVIKRRQILLVQVVKEERGNKGAALTTYLSLAGRYCVLMPNTARGGGISRKIASGQDRKRLKSILSEFGIPAGMAVIVRTAGAKRTKAEIKRDYEYLIRLWEQVRQKTLESIAPSAIHEEGNLIKRSIRDIYTKDIEEVIVDGEEGYRTAKDFMKLMMPSHAKRVQPYRDTTMPLLQRFGVESQIDSMHLPEVQLKSGGYIVINSTEALVAIDVNSGRSTRERNIEETAYKTNIEAAEEVARQLRLRDLAGLIVIDFIDMENHRNQGKVERTLKDAMRTDRARIQIGRISPFGLLEMSRQRLRPSIQEIHSEPCPHCAGTGLRRSVNTTALQMLRTLEEEAMRKRNSEITMHIPSEMALYILNHKRDQLARIEADYELKVYLEGDDSLIPPDYRMDKVKADGRVVEGAEAENEKEEDTDGDNENAGRKRRRRGRRRSRKDNEFGDERDENQSSEPTKEPSEEQPANDSGDEDEDEGSENNERAASSEDDDDQPKRPRRRRRGRRAGRRRGRGEGEGDTENNAENAAEASTEGADDESNAEAASSDSDAAEPVAADAAETAETETEEKPEKPKRRSRGGRGRGTKKAAEAVEAIDDKSDTPSEPEVAAAPESEAEAVTVTEAASEPKSEPTPVLVAEPDPQAVAEIASTTVIDVSQIEEAEKPTRRGWWRRG